MSKETPVFDDKIEEFMYKEGLCEECKKESEEVGFVDSFCGECHDKFMLLQQFKDFLKVRKNE